MADRSPIDASIKVAADGIANAFANAFLRLAEQMTGVREARCDHDEWSELMQRCAVCGVTKRELHDRQTQAVAAQPDQASTEAAHEKTRVIRLVDDDE